MNISYVVAIALIFGAAAVSVGYLFEFIVIVSNKQRRDAFIAYWRLKFRAVPVAAVNGPEDKIAEAGGAQNGD
jgi:vacuolar-type H+-ATPase subunit I/STV1